MATDFEYLTNEIDRFLKSNSKLAFELDEYAHKFFRSSRKYYEFLSSDPFLSTQYLAETVNHSCKHAHYELINALDVILALLGTKQWNNTSIRQRNGYAIIAVRYLPPVSYEKNKSLALKRG